MNLSPLPLVTAITDARHVYSQDVACILLQYVGGELKVVAKGTIIQPKNRVIHGKPMSDSLHRVCVASVLSGCYDVDPPVQPEGAEEHMTFGGCHDWTFLWPKTQICLAVEVTTPQTA